MVSTRLKNMTVSWEGLSHILWKIKDMFETTNQSNITNHIVVLILYESQKPTVNYGWFSSQKSTKISSILAGTHRSASSP